MRKNDPLRVAEFQPFRELSNLVLRHTCHDDQSELAVGVERIDVVVLEQDTDVMLQQLLRILDAVKRRT